MFFSFLGAVFQQVMGDKSPGCACTHPKTMRVGVDCVYQLTTLSAQQLLANASGLALKAKPIPSM